MAADTAELTLDRLLTSWRENRCPELADAIDRVSATIAPSDPTLATLPKKFVHSAWLKVSAGRRPGDVPTLLATLNQGTIDESGARLAELLKWPSDPRVAMAMARMVELVPFQSTSSQKHWTKVFALLVDAGDVRTVEVLQQVEKHPVAISGSSMRAWMGAAVPSCARKLEKLFVRGAPTPTEAQRALLAALGGGAVPTGSDAVVADEAPAQTLASLFGPRVAPRAVEAPAAAFALTVGKTRVVGGQLSPDGGWMLLAGNHAQGYRRSLWQVRCADGAVERLWVNAWKLAVSPDGRAAVCASQGVPLVMRSLEHGEEMGALSIERPEGQLQAAHFHDFAWSPDGRFVAASLSWGHRIYSQIEVFDLVEGTSRSYCKGVLQGGDKDVSAFATAFTPDGRGLWALSLGSLSRISLATGEVELQVLRAVNTEWYTALAVDPTGAVVATAKNAGGIQLWRADNGEALGALKGHTGLVNRLAFSADGKGLFSAAVTEEASNSYDPRMRVKDPALRFWNVAARKVARTIELEQPAQTAWLTNNALMVAEGATARLYALGGPLEDGCETTLVREVSLCEMEVKAVAVARRRGLMVSHGEAGLDVWLLPSGERIAQHEGVAQGLAITDDGERFATLENSRLGLWETLSGARLGELRGHAKAVHCAAFSPDGRVLVSGADDRSAIVWNPLELSQTAVLDGHRGRVGAVAFSADGRALVTACDDGCLRVWSPDGWALRGEVRVCDGVIRALSLSHDGALAAVATGKGAQVWHLPTQRCVIELPGALVTGVALRDDGALLAAIGTDGVLRCVAVEGGAEALRCDDLLGAGGVSINATDGWHKVRGALAFTGDGRALVVGAGRARGGGAMWVFRW